MLYKILNLFGYTLIKINDLRAIQDINDELNEHYNRTYLKCKKHLKDKNNLRATITGLKKSKEARKGKYESIIKQKSRSNYILKK